MRKSTLNCDDICEFSDLIPDADYSLVQLTPGLFGYSEMRIDLPKISLFLVEHQSGCVGEEFIKEDIIVLYFPIKAPGDLRWRNLFLDSRSMLIVGKGVETSYVFSAGGTFLVIQIDCRFLESLGWHLPTPSHQKAPQIAHRMLLEWCYSIFEIRMSALPEGVCKRLAVELQREAVLRLRTLFRDAGLLKSELLVGQEGLGGNFDIVLAAKKRLEAMPPDDRVSRPELAVQIGYSERQLHRAFQDWIGVAPAKYQALMRLHRLRAFLKTGADPQHKLTNIARQFGYSNPGRMAGEYNKLFREPPSETLRRARSR